MLLSREMIRAWEDEYSYWIRQSAISSVDPHDRLQKCYDEMMKHRPKNSLHITQVAVMQGGITWALPAPARHHQLNLYFNLEKPYVLGFLDCDGNFRDNRSALLIALRANQVNRPGMSDQLYSEDMW
jgi:hypothetical protein